MKRRGTKGVLPPRRDSRITSQYIPADGSIVIGVARGFSGAREVLYRIEAEKLAGAIEDRKELAVIVNNLGLLVLAQLCGFNLAESLDELPKALATWAHIDVKELVRDEQADITAALAIAQKTVHQMHGHQGGCEVTDRAKGEPCVCQCECTRTAAQTICAQWCGLCNANAELAALDPKFSYVKETDERRGQDSLPPGGNEGVGADGAGPGPDSPGAAPSSDVAADEQRP